MSMSIYTQTHIYRERNKKKGWDGDKKDGMKKAIFLSSYFSCNDKLFHIV